MEVFEIHITGDEEIRVQGSVYGLKTIGVELYHPRGHYLRTEYMTSIRTRFPDYDLCKKYVDKIESELRKSGVKIYRVKIESPVYPHYIAQSKYVESHFEAKNFDHAVSRNVRKLTMLGTDREYNQGRYDEFLAKWQGHETELCLFDSDPDEDRDWLDLYKKQSKG